MAFKKLFSKRILLAASIIVLAPAFSHANVPSSSEGVLVNTSAQQDAEHPQKFALHSQKHRAEIKAARKKAKAEARKKARKKRREQRQRRRSTTGGGSY